MTDEIKNVLDILDEYKAEIDKDVQLDRINIVEQQLKAPALKAKWVSRTMNHKKQILTLEDILEAAMMEVTKKIKNESPIEISDIVAERSAESHELIKKIKKQIKDERAIVEYLEKVERIFSSLTYDLKNIADFIKLETT